MARPRKDEGRDTRQDILDRALDLFAEHGFYGTSTRDIARAVGVRESALYHHFPSKAAILQELTRTLGPGKADLILQLDFGGLIEAMGPEPMLRHLVDMVLSMWATAPERKIFRVMLSEGPRLHADGVAPLLNFLQKGLLAIANLYRELRRRGAVQDLDPDAAARAFMGPMFIIRFTHLSLPDRAPDLAMLKAEAERHVTFFWNLVKATGRGAPVQQRNRTTVQRKKGRS